MPITINGNSFKNCPGGVDIQAPDHVDIRLNQNSFIDIGQAITIRTFAPPLDPDLVRAFYAEAQKGTATETIRQRFEGPFRKQGFDLSKALATGANVMTIATGLAQAAGLV